MLLYCGHFDENEISFRVIKISCVSATGNEITRKERSANAIISLKKQQQQQQQQEKRTKKDD